MGDLGSIPGLGRSAGEGKGYSLQYPGLKSSMDCIVPGITKSRTLLSHFPFPFQPPKAESRQLTISCQGRTPHGPCVQSVSDLLSSLALQSPLSLLGDEEGPQEHRREGQAAGGKGLWEVRLPGAGC